MSSEITVIKIGTGVLTREKDGTLDEASLVRLITSISELITSGTPCVIVSSGAVGAGVSALKLKAYPRDTLSRQACAAVGQTRLMHAYENLFQKFQLNVAQILITADDIENPEKSHHISNTLHHLLAAGNIIPIINENDSVAVEELRVGDNDILSAKVACLLKARLLIMLSEVDGLLNEKGELIKNVRNVDEVIKHVREKRGKFSIGGMASKLEAIRISLAAGVETVIANGRKPFSLSKINSGDKGGTRFLL